MLNFWKNLSNSHVCGWNPNIVTFWWGFSNKIEVAIAQLPLFHSQYCAVLLTLAFAACSYQNPRVDLNWNLCFLVIILSGWWQIQQWTSHSQHHCKIWDVCCAMNLGISLPKKLLPSLAMTSRHTSQSQQPSMPSSGHMSHCHSSRYERVILKEGACIKQFSLVNQNVASYGVNDCKDFSLSFRKGNDKKT